MEDTTRREAPAGPKGVGRGAAVVGFLVFFLASVAGTRWLDQGTYRPDEPQPISFNHKKHVEEVGLECADCHEYFATETFSGLPTVETCAMCHEEPQGDNPSREELRLVAMIQEGEALAWQPLFRQPPHVFYSHRRHVMVAGLECTECHGDIASTEAPPARVVRLTMERCRGCHEREGARTDCTTCHR